MRILYPLGYYLSIHFRTHRVFIAVISFYNMVYLTHPIYFSGVHGILFRHVSCHL